MHISFSPQRRDDTLSVSKNGDKLRINGELFSFVTLPEGGTIPAGVIPCEWIVGPVERVNGEVRLTLVLPHGPTPSAEVSFPVALVDPPDGDLAIPFDPQQDGPSVPTMEEPADVDG